VLAVNASWARDARSRRAIGGTGQERRGWDGRATWDGSAAAVAAGGAASSAVSALGLLRLERGWRRVILLLTEEEEAREGAGEGGVGDTADGEVEARVPLDVQVVPRRDPRLGRRGRGRRRTTRGGGSPRRPRRRRAGWQRGAPAAPCVGGAPW
jgi:hypothetical protein